MTRQGSSNDGNQSPVCISLMVVELSLWSPATLEERGVLKRISELGYATRQTASTRRQTATMHSHWDIGAEDTTFMTVSTRGSTVALKLTAC